MSSTGPHDTDPRRGQGSPPQTRLAPGQDDLRPGRIFIASSTPHTQGEAAPSRKDARPPPLHPQAERFSAALGYRENRDHKKRRGRPRPSESRGPAVTLLTVLGRPGDSEREIHSVGCTETGLRERKTEGFQEPALSEVESADKQAGFPLPLPCTLALPLPLSLSASLEAGGSSLFSPGGGGLKYDQGGVRTAPCGPAPVARAQT